MLGVPDIEPIIYNILGYSIAIHGKVNQLISSSQSSVTLCKLIVTIIFNSIFSYFLLNDLLS
jgi:hypothetical protein